MDVDGVKKDQQLKVGDSFGELALLYNSPRSAGIFALETTKVWVLSRLDFKKVLKDLNRTEKNENEEILKNIKFLEGLTDTQRQSLASNLVSL